MSSVLQIAYFRLIAFRHPKQFEQPVQPKQFEQPEQLKQCEQSEQPEQFKQFVQSEQYGQFRQSKQSTQSGYTNGLGELNSLCHLYRKISFFDIESISSLVFVLLN